LGNQQNLSPRVAAGVFEAVFPPYGAVVLLGAQVFCKHKVGVQVPSVTFGARVMAVRQSEAEFESLNQNRSNRLVHGAKLCITLL